MNLIPNEHIKSSVTYNLRIHYLGAYMKYNKNRNKNKILFSLTLLIIVAIIVLFFETNSPHEKPVSSSLTDDTSILLKESETSTQNVSTTEESSSVEKTTTTLAVTTTEAKTATSQATTTTQTTTTAKPTPVPTTKKPTPIPTTKKPTPVPTTAKPSPVPTTLAPTPVPTTTQALISPDGRTGAQLDQPLVINGIPIVNKNHWVNNNYRPLPDSMQNARLVDPAWGKYLEMKQQAASEGITLIMISSYRQYELQVRLFRDYSYNWGEAAANRFSARAGQSEHQTGLAIDITSGGGLNAEFANTPAGKWLWENAYKFGFILRYPQGKEHITGYMFEPWHYRYIGEEHAAHFGPNSSLTLEEYLGTN